MTEKEKQEIETVVGNYGKIKRKYLDDLHEIYRKQKEREIYWYIGDLQITELSKQLEKSDERAKFVELTKKLDDVEFEKHFRSACLREFLDIRISPEEL